MTTLSFRSALRLTVLAAAVLAGGVQADPAPGATALNSTPAVQKRQIDKLSAAFHHARASYDPLLFATANGDPRYNDQLGMTISPQRRAAQFALNRKMQTQLARIDRERCADPRTAGL